MMKWKILAAGIGGAILALGLAVQAQDMEDEHLQMHQFHAATSADNRQLVTFPEMMRRHTMSNMRDHLLALQQIQDALGKGQFDAASDIAENRLGMSSLKLHGAHEVANFMPAGMQEIGTRMHQAASQFAIAAKDAGVSGDIKPALTAYSQIMQQCVACHSSYRVQ